MPIKTDTKERMISAALDLFHLYGVNGTSIDQVLEKSSTGKSQFSHYFKSKDGLVHAVIQYLDKGIRSGLTPTGYNIHTWREMEGWFDTYIAFQKSVDCERSCPLGTIGNDLLSDQPLLRQDVRLFLEWGRGQLTRFFAERKAAGELVASADPDGLADLCISVMQGGMLLTKIKRDTDIFENAAQQALAYIKSLRKK
jgi:TetR/AcrR family transcriptional regulator, transcriptional repressor for nem operon